MGSIDLSLETIKAIHIILTDVGEIKHSIGKVTASAGSLEIRLVDLGKRLEILGKDISDHKDNINAHLLGEEKHDKEQSFSKMMQTLTLVVAVLAFILSMFKL
jgi:hypothetical protein